MKKTAVIYWSGTGNTEAMANAVLEGMTAAGADAKLLTVDQVNTAELDGYAAIAFGCSGHGQRGAEEMEFQPHVRRLQELPGRQGRRPVRLLRLGATVSGCAPGEKDCGRCRREPICDSVICWRPRTTPPSDTLRAMGKHSWQLNALHLLRRRLRRRDRSSLPLLAVLFAAAGGIQMKAPLRPGPEGRLLQPFLCLKNQ